MKLYNLFKSNPNNPEVAICFNGCLWLGKKKCEDISMFNTYDDRFKVFIQMWVNKLCFNVQISEEITILNMFLEKYPIRRKIRTNYIISRKKIHTQLKLPYQSDYDSNEDSDYFPETDVESEIDTDMESDMEICE